MVMYCNLEYTIKQSLWATPIVATRDPVHIQYIFNSYQGYQSGSRDSTGRHHREVGVEPMSVQAVLAIAPG